MDGIYLPAYSAYTEKQTLGLTGLQLFGTLLRIDIFGNAHIPVH